MKTASVTLYHRDPATARKIASTLREHFPAVFVVESIEELRPAIVKHQACLTVLDLEASRLSAIEELHREFPHVAIVCTHRLADEQMWTAAVEAGAEDICHPGDISGLLFSVLRTTRVSRSAAA